MTNDLHLFNEILHVNLRPWKIQYSEEKLRELLHFLPKENYTDQPLYEVSFPKPLTGKTKYYHALINKEAISYLNSLHHLITGSSNNNEKKFHIHTALSKRLKDKLKDTERVICGRQLFFSNLEVDRHDKQLRDNTWIIQYLKHQLIRLYLEIQDHYPEYLNDDPLTEEDMQAIYFTENTGENRIVRAPAAIFKPFPGKPLVAEPTNFEPLMRDVREPANNILKYSEMIASAEKFAAIERLLFQEKLIDSKYDFIKKTKGNIQKLAAVYVALMKKNYFNELYFPGRMKITDLQIRKFLNYRYNASIDREFRNFRNNQKGVALLESFIDEEPWIGLLPNGGS